MLGAFIGISVSLFFELQASGLAPRTMALGKRRKIIAIEEAQHFGYYIYIHQKHPQFSTNNGRPTVTSQT